MLTYVDTSALIALAVPADKNHKRAVTFLRASLSGGTRFVLGRPVLIEYIDGVTKRIGKAGAIEHLRALESSAVMRIEPDSEDDHPKARDLFLRYDDHPIDMTDCLAFAVMERLGLQQAFTFDRDFATHGLTAVPSPTTPMRERTTASAAGRTTLK